MDYEKAKRLHLGNISRQVGHNVSGRYTYILNGNELLNAYVSMRNELGYPLMMDSKYRRAIVYNKRGLEKLIHEKIIKAIVDNIHLIDKMVVEDITTQLNGLVQTANGTFRQGSNSNSKSFTKMFIDGMVKGLVQGVGNIIEDITNPKDKRRR